MESNVSPSQGSASGAAASYVTIEVNRKPVRMPGHEATGLQIKQAAIAQGVHIDLDFVLSRRVDHRHVTVRDDEHVKLHDGEEFHAVRPDDNS
jgi:hypothetical protein